MAPNNYTMGEKMKVSSLLRNESWMDTTLGEAMGAEEDMGIRVCLRSVMEELPALVTSQG